LKRDVRVDQSENSPTVLDSSNGWNRSGDCTISSEDGVTRNFKVPKAGEFSLLERNEIVPIGRKKRSAFGRTISLNSTEGFEENSVG